MGGTDDAETPAKREPAVKSKKTAAKSKARISTSSVSTPARRLSAGKENDTPSSTRSAKDKALTNLHKLAPDIALYEKERKRKGPVWGGERAANKIDKDTSLERSTNSTDEESDDADEGPKPKRPKASKIPPAEIRLLITGYKEWIGAQHKEDVERVCL